MSDPTWRLGILVVSVPIFLAGCYLLFVQGRSLARWANEPPLATLPFVTEHDVTLDITGPVMLNIDRPRMSGWRLPTGSAVADRLMGGRSVQYELSDAERVVRGEHVLVPVTRSGFSRIRYDVARFDLPRAGRYRFHVTGLANVGDTTGVQWVFARQRPFVELFGRIMGLILTAFVTFGALGGSIALSIMRGKAR